MKNAINYAITVICLSILSFLSSCDEKQTSKETTIIENDSLSMRSEETTVKEYKYNTDYKIKVKQESEEFKNKLQQLKERAKQKSGQAKSDLDESIDKIENLRKNFDVDRAGENMKEDWKEFKERMNNAIDSLEKKI